MTDENAAYDVVEVRLDGELIAEAPLPGDDVEAGPGAGPDDQSILGATPAETPDEPVQVESDDETPHEKFARLLDEGYKRSQLTAVTDTHGRLVDVQLA